MRTRCAKGKDLVGMTRSFKLSAVNALRRVILRRLDAAGDGAGNRAERFGAFGFVTAVTVAVGRMPISRRHAAGRMLASDRAQADAADGAGEIARLGAVEDH